MEALNIETINTETDKRTFIFKEEIICDFKKNITPKSVYAVFDCHTDTRTVTLGEMIINSRSLADHLRGCRRAVLLAATLGVNADMLTRKYSVQNMGKTLIAQSICADIIEKYLDDAEKEFSKADGLTGLFPVTRFSPGYGDFDIKYQKDILKTLDASRIGLSLTDGYMLTPAKSVTAVIGFSQEKKQRAFKCASCNWTCSTTRLVASQVLQFSGLKPKKLPFFSGSCSITEVIEQLY